MDGGFSSKRRRTSVLRPFPNDIASLCVLFGCWKTILFCLATISPGLGYDTSTDLLLYGQYDWQESRLEGQDLLVRLCYKLVRWDAIYFVSLAHRGYVHEQEWVFGWGFTSLVAWIAKSFNFAPDLISTSLCALAVANFAHLLSVLVLYHLVQSTITPLASDSVSYIAACLHILAPAGLFLSAPYAESLFSLLNFLGYLLYVKSRHTTRRTSARHLQQDALVFLSGCAFGLSCLMRSNGVFNGVIFAVDLAIGIAQLRFDLRNMRYLSALVLAGLSTGLGFAFPQILAYLEYCRISDVYTQTREWCHQVPPSIFSFAQSHYWHVGLFRYWTLSNLPLFIIASPMLYLLLLSSFGALSGNFMLQNTTQNISKAHDRGGQTVTSAIYGKLWRLAMPQLLLTILAIAVFHVQIVTRISSGYPLTYIWIAMALQNEQSPLYKSKTTSAFSKIIRFFIIYGVVQGGLFASFLPPA